MALRRLGYGEDPIREIVSYVDANETIEGAPVLKDVDIALEREVLLGILGPSGCGKTSLLRTIAGLDDAADGEVRLRGRSPEEIGWPVYRRTVTLVQQQPVMLDDTVLENLARPFRHRSVSRPFDRGIAVDLMETLGLTEHCLGQQARTLSVGEQQRIALLRAILIGPEVLLLDEPTSALDEESETIIEQVLRLQVRRDGRSAIVVTHDRRQAERLCDVRLDLQPNAIASTQHRDVDDG
jgi:ABC-type iron transport system FetAB ATPase subunit